VIDVLVVCTGNLRDYRLKDQCHADGLRDYIERNSHWGGNIRILGLIDYADVLGSDCASSVAVINPSRFRGLELNGSRNPGAMGKRLILSAISPFTWSKNPTWGAAFPFAPDDSAALAEILRPRLGAPGVEPWVGGSRPRALPRGICRPAR